MKKILELTKKNKPTLMLERKPEAKPRMIDMRTVALKNALVNKANPLQSKLT